MDIAKIKIKETSNKFTLHTSISEADLKHIAHSLLMSYAKLKNYLLKNFDCKIRTPDKYSAYVTANSKIEMIKILDYIQQLHIEILLVGKDNIEASQEQERLKKLQQKKNKQLIILQNQQLEIDQKLSKYVGTSITLPVSIETWSGCITAEVQMFISDYTSDITNDTLYFSFITEYGKMRFKYNAIKFVDNTLKMKNDSNWIYSDKIIFDKNI